MSGSYGPATWANVLYFLVGDTTHTPGEVIAEIAAQMHSFYHDGFGLGNFSSSWSTNYCTITYRDAEDSIVRLRVSDAMAGIGDASGQDAQVAYLVNWSTGDIRRGGKPRQYVCGVPDDRIADSARLSPGTVTGITGLLLTWLAALPGLTIPLELVEMSFRDGNAWRTAAAHYPIIGVSLNPVVATQRRRVNRLRPH